MLVFAEFTVCRGCVNACAAVPWDVLRSKCVPDCVCACVRVRTRVCACVAVCVWFGAVPIIGTVTIYLTQITVASFSIGGAPLTLLPPQGLSCACALVSRLLVWVRTIDSGFAA